MKRFFFLIFFYPFLGNSQVQSYTPNSYPGYLTITPNGITSKYSGNQKDSNSIAIGYNALINTDTSGNSTNGRKNVAIGAYSLFKNTTSYGNTAIGFEALKGNTTGIVNTAVGSSALPRNTIGFENVAIGQAALLSNITGERNVSIGTGSLLLNNGGRHNTAVGHIANWFNSFGEGNTSVGYNALATNTLGNNNVAIGKEANVASNSLSNSIAIGYQSVVNSSNKAVIGNASITTIGGYGAWTNYSDARLKENIIYDNSLGLDFILGLKTVTYNYKSDSLKRKRNGLIAQDIKQLLKEQKLYFGGLLEDNDIDKTLNLSYSELTLPLINAIIEQQKQLENLKYEILQLKNK
jgi:trimeric autotransporter adhesin